MARIAESVSKRRRLEREQFEAIGGPGRLRGHTADGRPVWDFACDWPGWVRQDRAGRLIEAGFEFGTHPSNEGGRVAGWVRVVALQPQLVHEPADPARLMARHGRTGG